MPNSVPAYSKPITRDITGEEHYSVLYAVEESPVQAGVIWSGSNDGLVQVTRDGGETWKDVTPPDMAPEGRIQNNARTLFSGRGTRSRVGSMKRKRRRGRSLIRFPDKR